MSACELYLYWKADAARGEAAQEAARNWQHTLRGAHPQLEARLLRRTDPGSEAAGELTVMETYRHPGGISDALQATIVDEGSRLLAPWLRGPRHVELFTPLD
jgi:hypothetical protein